MWKSKPLTLLLSNYLAQPSDALENGGPGDTESIWGTPQVLAFDSFWWCSMMEGTVSVIPVTPHLLLTFLCQDTRNPIETRSTGDQVNMLWNGLCLCSDLVSQDMQMTVNHRSVSQHVGDCFFSDYLDRSSLECRKVPYCIMQLLSKSPERRWYLIAT